MRTFLGEQDQEGQQVGHVTDEPEDVHAASGEVGSSGYVRGQKTLLQRPTEGMLTGTRH